MNRLERALMGEQIIPEKYKSFDEYFSQFSKIDKKTQGLEIVGYEKDDFFDMQCAEGLFKISGNYSFSIWNKGEEVSICSFVINDSSIDIIQQQSLSTNKRKELGFKGDYLNIHCNKALFNYVFELAKDDHEKVTIIPGKLQDSVHHSGASINQFEKIYDQGAISCGFTYNSQIKRYEKKCKD